MELERLTGWWLRWGWQGWGGAGGCETLRSRSAQHGGSRQRAAAHVRLLWGRSLHVSYPPPPPLPQLPPPPCTGPRFPMSSMPPRNLYYFNAKQQFPGAVICMGGGEGGGCRRCVGGGGRGKGEREHLARCVSRVPSEKNSIGHEQAGRINCPSSNCV